MPAVAATTTSPTFDPSRLSYVTYFDDKLRLWVAEATAPRVAMKAIGQTRAQALAILWRQVRKHLPPGN